MAKKEKTKLLDYAKEKLKKMEYLSKKELIHFGYSTDESLIDLGNLVLKKGGFLEPDYKYELKDFTKDIYDKKINQDKIFSLLKTSYESGKKTISTEILVNNGLFPIEVFTFHNLRIKSVSKSTYEISFIDKNKTIDNKWIDSAVNYERILEVLQKYTYTKEKEKLSEVQLNKELEIHFKQYFENIRRGDLTNKGLIDLNIGNGKLGIELKMAREIKKADQSQRARGQIEDYVKIYKNSLLIVIAGKKEDFQEKHLKEVITKAKFLGCGIYNMEAV